MYRNFVEELVKVNTVLDKQFFIILHYSPLEKGPINAAVNIKGKNKKTIADQAKAVLHSKANSLLAQLSSLNLPAKILQNNNLIRLYYEVYNQGSIDAPEINNDAGTAVIQSQLVQK